MLFFHCSLVHSGLNGDKAVNRAIVRLEPVIPSVIHTLASVPATSESLDVAAISVCPATGIWALMDASVCVLKIQISELKPITRIT